MSRIGFVAIGRNEGPRLRACLASLPTAAGTAVYVDSRSTDGSVALAESMGVDVISLDDGRLTAARGRQAGLDHLQRKHPQLQYVQFLDGDCVLEAGWLDAAAAHLDANEKVAGVCGRRREERVEASRWSRLIDIDWDIPPGEVPYFGGDVLARVDALQNVGGWNPALIAGEEPELCFRLRAAGWRIDRLDQPATRHDIAMTSFGEYWKRSRRSGHAYAEVGTLHADGPGKPWQKRAGWILVQGLVLPVLAGVGFLVWWPIGVLCLLPYAWWLMRMTRACRRRGYGWGRSLDYAAVNLASRPAGAMGVLRYLIGRWSGRRAKLMEYKAAAPSAAPGTSAAPVSGSGGGA
jgi:GT2 family glycosyltransferase